LCEGRGDFYARGSITHVVCIIAIVSMGGVIVGGGGRTNCKAHYPGVELRGPDDSEVRPSKSFGGSYSLCVATIVTHVLYIVVKREF